MHHFKLNLKKDYFLTFRSQMLIPDYLFIIKWLQIFHYIKQKL